MRAAVASSILAAFVGVLHAQNENRLQRDFRVEGSELKKCTSFSSLTDCGQTLVMGQPLHIAVGSLAPQNGVAAGLAFVEHYNAPTPNADSPAWRFNFNVDGVASGNGSWRTGAYVKAYTSSTKLPQPGDSSTGTAAIRPSYDVAPILEFHAQATSLNRVDFYGLGPDTTKNARTTFGMTQTILGASATLPVSSFLAPAHLSLLGELNGRFPSLRAGQEKTIPSIEAEFTEASAPGLSRQTGFLQASEGVRFTPGLFSDYLRLNYLLQFQQFMAPGDSTYSFRRFNGDFTHTIPIYAFMSRTAAKRYTVLTTQSDRNGPDDCARDNGKQPCPKVKMAQNLEGSLTFRALISESFAGRGSVVPFYFMPTLGGSDINGNVALGSYSDYRFRGPDLLLFRGTIEHSLGTLPVGGLFSVDGGKVGLHRDDISFDHFRHTFTAGLTLHAGGLPLVYLLFSWGGGEGNHTSATISPYLLGGSARPSLF